MLLTDLIPASAGRAAPGTGKNPLGGNDLHGADRAGQLNLDLVRVRIPQGVQQITVVKADLHLRPGNLGGKLVVGLADRGDAGNLDFPSSEKMQRTGLFSRSVISRETRSTLLIRFLVFTVTSVVNWAGIAAL